ncbi:MAG: GAF domain-containing protein [Rhodothermia bacterium]|nr:MAG: GAF domain-containing protein [Rhodothermia bacterium]
MYESLINGKEKRVAYERVAERIWLLIDESTDWVGAMATVVCELHHAFDYFHWTGFYRTIRPEWLQVGPYQGGHGCIDISFTNGVCGAAARTQKTQLLKDVTQFSGHIDCSPTTQSEIVVPIVTSSGETVAVLDVDSDNAAAFDELDLEFLEAICNELAARYAA